MKRCPKHFQSQREFEDARNTPTLLILHKPDESLVRSQSPKSKMAQGIRGSTTILEDNTPGKAANCLLFLMKEADALETRGGQISGSSTTLFVSDLNTGRIFGRKVHSLR